MLLPAMRYSVNMMVQKAPRLASRQSVTREFKHPWKQLRPGLAVPRSSASRSAQTWLPRQSLWAPRAAQRSLRACSASAP